MSRIVEVRGREIIDSRGNPTVEADVVLDSGAMGRAAVPSGASTGSREAVELRDGDAKRFRGKGVRKAVEHVNGALRGVAVGLDPADQARARREDDRRGRHRQQIEARRERDPGGVARRRACRGARPQGCRLYRHLRGRRPREFVMPVPMMNIINGGAHADNSVDIQEFMILPLGAPSLAEAVRYGAEVFHALKKVLHAKGLNTAVGDEGGFAPDLPSNEAALATILEAIDKAGYRAGRDIYLGLDVASTEFYKNGVYDLESEGRKFDSSEFADYLAVARGEISHRHHRGRHERGRLGRLGRAHAKARRQAPARRRRRVRHQHQDLRGGDREENRQRHSHQAESDRHADRDAGGDRHGGEGEVRGRSSRIARARPRTRPSRTSRWRPRPTQIKTGSMSRSDRVAKYNQLLRIEGRARRQGGLRRPECTFGSSFLR